MDLILAYKQGMKLAEIAGLSVSKQTSFATAVSEVCRDIVLEPNDGLLRLGISIKKDKAKMLHAIVSFSRAKRNEGSQYAKRLIDNLTIAEVGNKTEIGLCVNLPDSPAVTDKIIEKWNILLNHDPSVTPYEEIKRKNKELLLLAEKLRASELQYKTLTDSLPLMIFTLDTEGNVTYANKWMQDYVGGPIDELNAARWGNVVREEDLAAAWTEWQHGYETGSPRKTERRLLDKKTGAYKWHAGATIPVTNEKGKIESFNAFLADIDAQKKVEQALKDNKELKEAQDELEKKINELNQSNQELEQFAYVASHDLQEPLRKISFYSDYIKSKYLQHLPTEGQMFLNNIAVASARMKQLIHDVLTFSTISSNKGFSTIDLNNVVQEAIQDNEITIKDKGAQINYTTLPKIQGIQVHLKQLFENLLSNALKFTDPATDPIIDIEGEVAGEMLTVKFSDNGIGFDDRYMDKMFSLFQRLHTRDKYEGTGIGLGICKKIVTLHNGEISAVSSPGNGSTFIVRLPVTQTIN